MSWNTQIWQPGSQLGNGRWCSPDSLLCGQPWVANSNSKTKNSPLSAVSGEATASSSLHITTYFWPNETAQSLPYLIFSSSLLHCSSSRSFWNFEFILYHLIPACQVNWTPSSCFRLPRWGGNDSQTHGLQKSNCAGKNYKSQCPL